MSRERIVLKRRMLKSDGFEHKGNVRADVCGGEVKGRAGAKALKRFEFFRIRAHKEIATNERQRREFGKVQKKPYQSPFYR